MIGARRAPDVRRIFDAARRRSSNTRWRGGHMDASFSRGRRYFLTGSRWHLLPTYELRDRSGGECAFKGCSSRETLEEAHIEGQKRGAARYEASLERRLRDGYDNLILLCGTHHTIIDDQRSPEWTVDVLRAMKTKHEQDIASRKQQPISELAEEISARGSDAKSVTGADTRRATKILPGTRITAEGTRVDEITGVRIGGTDGE